MWLSLGIIDNAEDSLFSYAVNESWSTFYRPDFIPTYDVEFSNPFLAQQAIEVCGSDQFCLFDTATTDNLQIGTATLQGNIEFEQIVESFQPG